MVSSSAFLGFGQYYIAEAYILEKTGLFSVLGGSIMDQGIA